MMRKKIIIFILGFLLFNAKSGRTIIAKENHNANTNTNESEKYKGIDKLGKDDNLKKEVNVSIPCELEKNIIDVNGIFSKWYTPPTEQKFSIGFDDSKKEIRIFNQKNNPIHDYFRNTKYFSIEILSKVGKEKLYLNIEGSDYGDTEKLDVLNGFKYEYGDKIRLWHAESQRLRIYGDIKNAKKDYSKRESHLDITEMEFEITKNGLVAIYNDAPAINGVEYSKVRVGDSFDILKGISATDDHDGNITNRIKTKGNVDVNTVGKYSIEYEVTDSWGKMTQVKRIIEVINPSQIEENTIVVNGIRSNIYGEITEKKFSIGFNDLKKEIKIFDQKNIGVHDYFKNRKYFEIKILSKDRKEKLSVVIEGGDYGVTDKLNILKGYKYEYGDRIKLWHAEPVRLNIYGKVEAARKDYSKRERHNEINEMDFEITQNGLKAIYNEAPVINGIENLSIKIGSKFDSLRGVTVTDDHDNNLVPMVTGNVETNKLGNYTLFYSVTDSWGKKTIKKRTVTVRSDTKPVIALKENKGIDIEKDTKVDDNYLKNLITVHDAEDGDLINRINISSNINSEKPGEYEVLYSIEDSDGNISMLKSKVNVIRSLSVSVPTKIAFHIVTNVKNGSNPFKVAKYKIKNNNSNKVKVYLSSFIKEEGSLNIVDPNTVAHWNELSFHESMNTMALGLYTVKGFKGSGFSQNNPIWLNNKMNVKTYLGEIQGGNESECGEISFKAMHGNRFYGNSIKSRYTLVLEFE